MNPTQIKKFRNQKLPNATSKDIKTFLSDVAESLKEVKDFKEAPKLIHEVGPLIYDIRAKVIKEAKSRELEKTYKDVKGLLQGLEEMIEKGAYGRVFYSEVYELGMLIEDLATIIKVLTPVIAFWDN